ncbi:MAG TPA: alginate export family protein [Bacteroidales bacterium]|nr:alginate export family protein [Bacteroidales bacterium]
MKRLFLIISLSTIYIPVFSQFLLSGEFRPRTEFRDGYKTLLSKDQNPALVTSQRTRLNMNYNDKRVSTRFSVQDVRTWGESALKTDASSMNIFEAWAELMITDEISVKLGRQELSFDQNRLMGASNWNDVGASHDLLLLKFHKNFDMQAGLAYNNDKSKVSESNYSVSNYKSLGFLRAEKNIGKYINVSVIGIADGYEKEADYKTIFQRYTYGCNLQLKNDSLRSRVYASSYFQSGKNPDGIPINAYFMSVNYDYAFTKSLNGIIAAEYFSGDDAFSTDSRYNSFNNLYGNGHGTYGYMDYFLQIDKDTRNGGLLNLYARGTFKFSRKVSGELSYHYLSLTNNIIDSLSVPGNNIKAHRYLGSEVDLNMKFKAADNVELSAGYSVMLATPTMEILKGGDHTRYQNWAWVMLTFKPEFLNTGKNQITK